MKEIKFRAWNKTCKELCKVHSIHLGTNKVMVAYKGGGNYSLTFNEVELMQYTELHDKNDNEIYEGDICLVSCRYFNIKNQKSKVIFKDGCFCFQYGCTDDYVKTYNALDLDSIEVIGNIYENPTLLQTK